MGYHLILGPIKKTNAFFIFHDAAKKISKRLVDLSPELLGRGGRGGADHGHGDGTTVAAEGIPPLDGNVGEATEAALDDARARAVGTDLADAGDEASVDSRGGSLSAGGGSSRRSVRVGSGSVAGDGTAGTVTLLLDGEGLKHGVGLLGGGVDGENHALSAVVALAAVEPFTSVLE